LVDLICRKSSHGRLPSILDLAPLHPTLLIFGFPT
jgi:hypothetical protein